MANEQWAKDQMEKYNKENQSDIRRNDAIRDWDYTDFGVGNSTKYLLRLASMKLARDFYMSSSCEFVAYLLPNGSFL